MGPYGRSAQRAWWSEVTVLLVVAYVINFALGWVVPWWSIPLGGIFLVQACAVFGYTWGGSAAVASTKANEEYLRFLAKRVAAAEKAEKE